MCEDHFNCEFGVMIITREDNFTRKTKSTVKITSEISISSSRNNELMKPDILKKSLLHMTESDITSNRGTSRKKLINSVKRTPNRRSSTTDGSSCSLCRHNSEFLSHIEEYSDLNGMSVKSSSSHYYCRNQSVCSSSELESVANIFKNNLKRGHPDSKCNYTKIILGKTKKNEQFQLKATNMKHRRGLMFTNDKKHFRKNINSADIQFNNSDRPTSHKRGRQQFFVFNVHCTETSKKPEKEYPSHPFCDHCCSILDENKGANAFDHKEATQNMRPKSIRFESCNLKEPTIKKGSCKVKPTEFSHHYPITENCDDYLTSNNINIDYTGCNEDCFGTAFNQILNENEYHKTTCNDLGSSLNNFPAFLRSNRIESDRTMQKTPPSITNMNTNICDYCPFQNFASVDQTYSQRIEDVPIQGVDTNLYGNRYMNQRFGSCQLFPDPQTDLFEEKNSIKNNTAKPTRFSEDNFISAFPPGDNTTDKTTEKLTRFPEDNFISGFPPGDNTTHKTTEKLTRFPEDNFISGFPLGDNTTDKKLLKEERTNTFIPIEKRKRHCTLCRAGTVDEGELSLNPMNENFDTKMETNLIEPLNKGDKHKLNDNIANIKQAQKSQVENEDFFQRPHKGYSHPTFDEPEQVVTQRNNLIPPCRITNNRNTKIPFQPIQNREHNFCDCRQYFEYVHFQPKCPRRIRKPHQAIPHNINQSEPHYSNIESQYTHQKNHSDNFDERIKKIDREMPKEITESVKFVENTIGNLIETAKTNKEFIENDNKVKISKRNKRRIRSVKPLDKKNRSCTLCRSGRVDEGELRIDSINDDVINSKTSPLLHDRIQSQGNHDSDDINENIVKSMPLKLETTKAVRIDSKNIENTAHTLDIGRNITIQIIPNFASLKTCYEEQNEERVLNQSCKFVEDCVSNSTKTNIPQNQIDIRIRKSEENVFNPIQTSDLNRPIRITSRDRYWKSEMKDRQSNKWWSCSWRRKKYRCPEDRNANFRITQDCCNSVDDISSEQDCQRVIPVSHNQRIVTMKSYSVKQKCSTNPNCSNTRNKEESMLRYMHRLNKTIVQDLLATPCPSTSTAYIQTYTQDTKKDADPLPYTCNLKPSKVNQCSQYESDSNYTKRLEDKRGSNTALNENKILYECLKQLTKKISYIENRFESEEEYDNYSPQDYNNCCYCCNRIPRCCCCSNITVPRRCNKKIKPCTQSRSVEVIRLQKHCGTVTSKECIHENACTNTEIRPKMSKAVIRRKCRQCCRPPCCHCCRQTPCCPCLPDFDKEYCNSQIISCQYESESPCCQNDKILYNCQCEYQICQSQFDLKRNVHMETKDTSTTEYQSVKSCQCNEAKSEVKSTNTTAILEYAQITNDEFMKSLTFDLCNLGDKTLSKFGVPSRQYPWSTNNFLPNMPNEIYRFIRTESYQIPISEPIYDPTPCLRPEILNINNTNVSQDIQLIDIDNKLISSEAAGDIQDTNYSKKPNLTSICEAIFNTEDTGNESFQNCINVEWVKNGQVQFCNEQSSPRYINSSKFLQKEECLNPIRHTNNQHHKKESTDVRVDVDKHNTKFEEEILPQKKIDIRRNKSGIKLTNKRTVDSIQPKKNEKNKTLVNTVNKATYVPKPFTTKTGLMSFIPPFRDSYRSFTQVNKAKQKLPVGKLSRSNINRIPIKKTKNAENILQSQNLKCITDKTKIQTQQKSTIEIENGTIISIEKDILTNANKSDNEEPEESIIETDSDTELALEDSLTENALPKKKNKSDFVVKKNNATEKIIPKFPERPTELNKLEIETSDQQLKNKNPTVGSPIKFDEIYSFYDKCFKPSNDPKTVMSVPYFKTNVADIVKSLEFKRSSTTKSFLHSLVGSVVNSENQDKTTSKNFLFDENIRIKNFVELTNSDPIYENFFTKSSYQNAVQIPQKILSKTDLISLK